MKSENISPPRFPYLDARNSPGYRSMPLDPIKETSSTTPLSSRELKAGNTDDLTTILSSEQRVGKNGGSKKVLTLSTGANLTPR